MTPAADLPVDFWDDLIIAYGEESGVMCGGSSIRLHASRDGCTARVPEHTFNRLVAEGRLTKDGMPTEGKSDG